MNGFVNGFYNFSVWITRLAYVNLLWVAFTILGLGILGLFPATAAMFAVVRKWMMEDEDIPIFKTFWKSYRIEFKKANVVGYILLLIGYVLFAELQILWAQENTVYFVASFGVLAIFFIYFIILLYLFPIFVHFNLKTFQYIKWPAIIGIIHPLLTIVLGVGILFIHYLTFVTLPALLFFFGGSVTAYILMWGASKTFSKYEQAETA
ncbi:hypothetical protein CIL03_11595 [Virgibacillus indicus]|uniref:DUF624 domain-containing protein n=1 Tax=Virgibacillus indicus TaxID=2024554 RepID=A0A265N905_9BACI|nr:YesL family protein [Virgibacillus indicus]OZU88291.1 hypothetical protein CIL03_11595 [Virgibacillus indicus]